MKVVLSVCLASALAVCLLACAHGPNRTVMEAGPAQESGPLGVVSGDEEVFEPIDLDMLMPPRSVNNNLLAGGPLVNIFGNNNAFASRMNVAMVGNGGSLFGRHSSGDLTMMGVGGGLQKARRSVKPVGPPSTVSWSDAPRLSGAGVLVLDDVNAVLVRANGMDACQALFFKDAPPTATQIKVQFTILPDGQAANVTFLEQRLNAQVSECVLAQFEAMDFSQTHGGEVVVDTVMIFEPE